MLIRPFVDDDLVAVVQIFTDSVHQLARGHYDADQRDAWAPHEPDVAAWRSRLNRVTTRVADEGGVVCGFIVFDDGGYVDMLYVSPGHARRGVATRLYAAAESSNTL